MITVKIGGTGIKQIRKIFAEVKASLITFQRHKRIQFKQNLHKTFESVIALFAPLAR